MAFGKKSQLKRTKYTKSPKKAENNALEGDNIPDYEELWRLEKENCERMKEEMDYLADRLKNLTDEFQKNDKSKGKPQSKPSYRHIIFDEENYKFIINQVLTLYCQA